jgi:hypothetical protein
MASQQDVGQNEQQRLLDDSLPVQPWELDTSTAWRQFKAATGDSSSRATPPTTQNQAAAPPGMPSRLSLHHRQHTDHLESDVELSFDGMNAVTTRYLVDNAGISNPKLINRVQREPANPGLAVGHGFVLETATSTLRIYDQASGEPLMPPVSLTTFFGLPNEATRLNLTSATFGPIVVDAAAWYDAHARRWFVTAATADTEGPSSAPPQLLANYLDIAVSDGPDPTGAVQWFANRFKQLPRLIGFQLFVELGFSFL